MGEDMEKGAILVVDDNDFFRDSVVTMLEALGYRPIPTCGPKEARKVLKQEEIPDLIGILTDFQMRPDINGIEFLEYLARGTLNSKTDINDVPKVLWSGDILSETQKKAALVAGAAGVYRKDASIQQVLSHFNGEGR